MSDIEIRRVKLPRGFDPTNEQHMVKLNTQIQEAAAKDKSLAHYTIFRIDEQQGCAFLAPMDADPDDIQGDVKYFQVDVAQAQDPKRTSKYYEERNPGYFMTDLNPVQRTVTMERLDEKTLAARRIFANVIHVDPWQVRVTSTPEGGWKIRIRKDAATWVQSKYGKAMQEAVERVGRPGWWFKADPESNVVMVYPGVLPTFPAKVPMPEKVWRHPDPSRAYFGVKLPERGRKSGEPAWIDWKNNPGVLVSGASNGGKSVLINSIIYNHLAAGGDLAVVDDADKSGDFAWCAPWIHSHCNGCDGIESCAAVLKYILEICSERADYIKERGRMNWYGLDEEDKRRYPLMLLVCDEIAQWAVPPKVPSGLDKDNPDLIRAKYEVAIKSASFTSLLRISQKARFAGICFLYSAQYANQQNGLDPSVRVNLTAKILPGEKVAGTVFDNVLNDPRSAPHVPQNVIRDGVGRGCGVAEITGQESFVYKGYYEEDPGHGREWSDILLERLESIRPRPQGSDCGRMPPEEITRLVPAAMERPGGGDEDGEREPSRLEREGGFGLDGRDAADRDEPLRGAARAAHASAVEQAMAVARSSAGREA